MMKYLDAYERVFDQIDFYYQYNHRKSYFDFKAQHSFKLAQASMRIFLTKLDEHKFNRYIPSNKTDSEMRSESTLHPTMQKMCNALRILNLMVVFGELAPGQIRKLNIDIPPGNLVRMYHDMPRNFNFLREHLNELIFRFHPYVSSEDDRVTINIVRGSVDPVPLLNTAYDYDDVVGEPSRCCFPCSFFGRRKTADETILLYENDHLKSRVSINYSSKEA